jgi:hypothetical protein
MGSFFDDLFTSPREREGKERGGQLLSDIENTQSIYADPNRMSQIGGAVNQQFSSARANVGTANARARQAAARRMGVSSATPEMTFGNIDASFAPAYGQVEESAQDQTGRVLQGQDAFAMNKLGARGRALQEYLQSLSDTSMGGDVLRGAASLAGIPTGKNAFLGKNIYDLFAGNDLGEGDFESN